MRNTTMMEKLAAVFPPKKEESKETPFTSTILSVPVEEKITPTPEPPVKPAIPVTKAKSPATKAKKKKAKPAKKSSAKTKKVTTSTKKPAVSATPKKAEVLLQEPIISQVETTDTMPLITTIVNTNEISGPRYVPNPRMRNPFSVHVYPVFDPGQNGDPYAKEPEAPVLSPETTQSVTEAVSEQKKDTETEEPVVLQNAHSVVETSQPEPALQIVEKPKEDMNTTQAVIVSSESTEEISLVPQLKPALPTEIKDLAEPAEKPAAVVSTSSNLEWLNKPTPFKDHLKGMVENLRDAKNNIAFTLEQLRGRQKKLEGELFEVQFSIEQQKENLRQLDDTISACALVAEQSASIPPGLLTSATVHKTHAKTENYVKGKNHYRDPNNPSTCRQLDIEKFFADNPDSDWTAHTICECLPPIKQEHARKYLSVLLPTMFNSGKIQRVALGTYRALES
jgi:hypothetical protein